MPKIDGRVAALEAKLKVLARPTTKDSNRLRTAATVVSNESQSSKKAPSTLIHRDRSSALTHKCRSSAVLDRHLLAEQQLFRMLKFQDVHREAAEVER
jgi:hypothetical protein